MCIEVTQDAKSALISEPLCIGCGICVKKCPFEAIAIINLPKNLNKDTTHRYGFITHLFSGSQISNFFLIFRFAGSTNSAL